MTTTGSLKPFLSTANLTDGGRKCPCKTKLLLICFFFGVISGFNAFWGVKNYLELKELHSQIEQMLPDIEEIMSIPGYLDMMKDLKNFEKIYKNAYTPSKDVDLDTLSYDDDDAMFESDYLWKDEEEESTDNSVDDIPFDGSGDYPNDMDPTDTDTHDWFKEYARKKRFARSIASRNGVPVVDESYALKRNQTQTPVDNYVAELLLNKNNNDPQLKYDWTEKEQQQWRPRRIPHRRRSENMAMTESPIHHAVVYHATFAPYTDVQTRPTTRKRPEIQSRRSRVMQTNEDKSKAFRQTIKKSEYEKMKGIHNQNGEMAEMNAPPQQVAFNKKRVGRPMHKSMDGKARHGHRARDMAAHFVGHHMNGRGHAEYKHSSGVYVNFEPASWTSSRFFTFQSGTVTVNEGGLYVIYAQIYFNDDHDHMGYRVNHNEAHLLYCTISTYSNQTESNTCYTSGIAHLKAGDTIQLEAVGNDRSILSDPSHSFFGLYKIGNVPIQN